MMYQSFFFIIANFFEQKQNKNTTFDTQKRVPKGLIHESEPLERYPPSPVSDSRWLNHKSNFLSFSLRNKAQPCSYELS